MEVKSSALPVVEAELSTSNPWGHPLQVISISDDKKEIQLDEGNLQVILDNLKDPDIPEKLALISIVGAYRTGKSFLLNIFLSYLRQVNPETKQLPEDDDVLFGADANLAKDDTGFKWRGGRHPETLGIWMHSKPFVLKLPSGEDVAVLLMDTQGMFDHETPPQLTRAIFGLTTLLSSYQIMNVKYQIQDNTLQEVHHFTEFAHSAMREIKLVSGLADKASGSTREEDGEVEEARPFQTLEFLIRDYQHEDLPADDPKACRMLMNTYLEETLGTSGQYSSQDARARIKDSFTKVDCFLLPQPGSKMASPSWNGNFSDVDDGFKRLCALYVRHVFGEALVTKRSLDREVFREWTEVFKGGDLPEAMTMVQAMTRTYNLHAKDEAMKKYRAVMSSECTSYLVADAFRRVHESAAQAALDMFRAVAKYGSEEERRNTRQELQSDIEVERARFTEENHLRLHKASHMAFGLNQLAPVLAATLVMLAADLASNVLCDWWSDTCVKASWYLWISYVLGFAIIAAAVFYKYKSEGKNVAVQSSMGLLSRVVEMFNNAYDIAASYMQRGKEKAHAA
eukprot:jgi/Chlat1/6731/Chrsp50S06434